MEYLDVVKNRRSIRKYKDDVVPEETIIEILKTAALAPSAHNKQPWLFKIVNKEDTLKIAQFLYNKKSPEDFSIEHTASIIQNIQHLVLIFSSEEDLAINDYLSLGAAIEHICLSATNYNLGSLWIGHLLKVEKEIKDHFKINNALISAVALGYPDQYPKPRPRKNFEDLIM